MTLAGPIGAKRTAPPPLASEDESFDLTPIARTFWDAVAIYGPAAKDGLFTHFPATAINYREFIRFHPRLGGDTGTATTRRADRWMFEQTVDRCIRNGWLKSDSGALAVASVPPHHTPLSTVGGLAGLRNILLDTANRAALEALTASSPAKRDALRRRPTADGVRQLTASIALLGQIDPILVWSPPKITGLPDVIVDGVVRSQILEERGVAPQVRFLITGSRGPVTPVEVLLTRIELDLASSSKGGTQTARDGYLSQLRRAGVDQAHFIIEVFEADRRADEVMRLVESCPVSLKPADSDITRMIELRDAGWQSRDIATETGWHKSIVGSYLQAVDDGLDRPTEEIDVLPKQGTKARRMLESFARMGSATLREACEAAGMDRRDISNQSMNKLLSDDLLQKSGQKGRAEVFRVTRKASQLLQSAHS